MLDVSSLGNIVEARDVLGARGIVIRDSLPDQFLTELAGPLGDVNGDGLDDMAIFSGAVGWVVFEEMHLVWGRASFPDRMDRQNIAEFSTRFLQAHPEFGCCDAPRGNFGSLPKALPAGDMDRDGFEDFFIGTQRYAPLEFRNITAAEYRPGLVYLVHGSPQFGSEIDLISPPDGVRMVRFSSTKPNNTSLGEDMSAGDFNGDGISDLAFAAPQAQAENAPATEDMGPGRAYVLLGREEGYEDLVDLEAIGSRLPGAILQGSGGAGRGFGMEVEFVGDVNGDGMHDLLIGVTSYISPSGQDHALLLYGTRSLPSRLTEEAILDAAHGARFRRQASLTDQKQSFAPLGDVNSDGLSDFLLGAPGEDQGRGAAYVVFGRDFLAEQVDVDLGALVAAGRAVRFAGEGRPDWGVFSGSGIGSAVSTIDYDADGELDLLLGSAGVAIDGVHKVGQGYVVKGAFEPGRWSLSGLRTGELEGAILTSELPEWLGQGIQGVGDMNGDGSEDILVAGPYIHGTLLPSHLEPGLSADPSAYVVFGPGASPLPLEVSEALPPVGPLEGGSESTLLGQGFRNGMQVTIGGRAAEVVRIETSSRAVVRVPQGERLGPAEIAAARGAERARIQDSFHYIAPFYPDLDGEDLAASGNGIAIGAGFGRAAALDHDGDGFGDVVVDSDDGIVIVYGAGVPVAGGVIAVAPGMETPPGTARLRLSDREGHEPFAVGDVNADGKADLAVVSEGVVTMVFGGERFSGTQEVEILLETSRISLISVSGDDEPQLAGGADADGDGIGDFVLYRPGRVNLVRGRATWPPLRGLALDPVITTIDESNSNRTSAALVGDIDADGRSEMLIGAPGFFWADRGKGFLVFGEADWNAEVLEVLAAAGKTFQINSVKEKDSLGFDVTGVGDFNGDGVPDLALSAKAGSLEFAGESYVVFGRSMLRGAQPLELADLGDQGVRIRGEFGYDEAVDLAPAGDFNGDGRQDLLISGGNFTTADNPFPSRSFVVFGGARGLLDLGKLGDKGFRIHVGERAQSVGATDFNGDGFDDVVVRGATFVHVVFGSGAAPPFIRGDSDRSGDLNIADAITILNHLFLGAGDLKCRDAADADDDGRLEITDPVYLLGHLFLGTVEPPSPFPTAGEDPTQDTLDCEN
jgi:hypothetical protein